MPGFLNNCADVVMFVYVSVRVCVSTPEAINTKLGA